jgi:hypothetical protein
MIVRIDHTQGNERVELTANLEEFGMISKVNRLALGHFCHGFSHFGSS